MQSRKRISLFDLVNILLMLLLIVVMLYPLYYILIVSISYGAAVARGEVTLYPVRMTLKAYEIIFADAPILNGYKNTLLYTGLGVLVNLLFTSLCAYPLSRKEFAGKTFFSLFIVFTMFFDGGMIPRFLVVHALGMTDTIWAMVIPSAISVMYMIMMRTFFQGIPEGLYESAYIDGANDFTIFTRIVLPLSAPVMATMTLFYSVSHWNSFFPALIYLNETKRYPLQIILRNMVIQGDMSAQSVETSGVMGTMVVDENIKYAVVIISILPILLLYPLLQKYFVKGAMIGSIKG